MSTLTYGVDDFDFYLDPTGIEESSSSENSSMQNIDSESSEDENEDCESSKITTFIRGLRLDRDTKWLDSISSQTPLFTQSHPGTYGHFLALLFESSKNILQTQADTQRYLKRHYSDQLKRVDSASKQDSHDFLERDLLVSELQTLRELLAPIRVNANAYAISETNWIEKRGEDVDDTKQALIRAADIISEFGIPSKGKNGLSGNSSDEERRSVSRNLRLARLDEIKPTTASRSSNSMNKASAGTSQTPAAQSLASGQSLGHLPPCSKTFLIATAHWLAKARNTTAVDLFCDVGQLFSTSSRRILEDEELLHLWLLSTLYPSEANTQHIGNPWFGYDPEMPNSQYFRDCETSQKSMMGRVRVGPAPERISRFAPPRRQGFQLTSDIHRLTTES